MSKTQIEIHPSIDTFNIDDLFVQLKTKSAVIRHLHGQGVQKAVIAKTLGIRYQHVRNVLLNPLKTVHLD